MKALYCLSFSLLFSLTAAAQDYVPGEVIVKLKGQQSSIGTYSFMGKANMDKGMVLKESWGKMNMHHFAVGKGQTVDEAVAELRRDPEVEYAEPNYILKKATEPGMLEAQYTAQEVMANAEQAQGANMATGAAIDVQTVWSSATAQSTTRPIVAVIDTGLDTTHYVIENTDALWTNTDEIPGNGIDDDGNGYVDDVHGWNFVSNSGTMIDDDGHGTHVSGIVLSVDQNIYASTLHRSKIEIMPLKFLDGNGSGSTSNAIRAIYYAVNNGATVLNNSWGGSSYSSSLLEAINYSYSKGAIFVAAAGNAGTNNDSAPMYPSNYSVPNVLSVAATTDSDYKASFSNFGKTTVNLGSPGVYILSTIPGDAFGTMSGTSMATPFVAGTAAQMKVASPNMLGYQVKSIILNKAFVTSKLTNAVSTSGRLSSASAVSAAGTASVETSQPSYSTSGSADRQLASAIAGGGCGTVKALTSSSGEPPFSSGAGVVLALVLAPLAMLVVMRLRNPASKRRFERFKIDSDVRISVGDRELVGSLSSISLGGAQVNTSALLQDGGMVTLSISSPDGGEKVDVSGRVVWSEANKAYGVAFDHAPQSALSRIADWTKGLQKAS